MFVKMVTMFAILAIGSRSDPVDTTGKGRKRTVEFLESIKGQGYLDYVSFKDRFILDLYALDKTLKTSDIVGGPKNGPGCPKQIYDSLGIASPHDPAPKDPTTSECNKMQTSCCNSQTFASLSSVWKRRYSKYVELVQSYFRHFLTSLLEIHPRVQPFAATMIERSGDARCRRASEFLANHVMTEVRIEEIRVALARALAFDRRLKQGFACFLCDVEFVRHFDVGAKTFAFNRNVCEAMAIETFDFYTLANEYVFKYINTLSLFLTCLPEKNRPERYGRVSIESGAPLEFLEIDDSGHTSSCRTAIDKNLNVFVNCLHYCSTYDLWHLRGPLYRSIEQLARITELAKKRIGPDLEGYTIGIPPSPDSLLPFLPSKTPHWDLFNTWRPIFAGDDGGSVQHLVYTEDNVF